MNEGGNVVPPRVHHNARGNDLMQNFLDMVAAE